MAFVQMASPLTASECLARLRAGAEVSERQPMGSWPSINDPMLVRVVGRRFRLMKASGGPKGNSFRRMFHGEVLDSPTGSIVRGRFRLHFVVRAFLFVWLSGITYVAVRVLLTSDKWSFVAFPVLIGWFG